MAACLIQPIMINESEGDGTVTIDDRETNMKRIFYASPRVHSNLRKLIPYFDQFGVFD